MTNIAIVCGALAVSGATVAFLLFRFIRKLGKPAKRWRKVRNA
jgi:hypothetical protein